jgi:ubiquinone/menaquinone biosynthesis C-methylase UbiE
MSKLTNPAYLKTQQYKDASNLNARVSLHERFSMNPYGWFRWAFDQYEMPPTCCVLELGCGSGELWRHNRWRIPEGWQITLTDFSEGMLAQARQNLGDSPAFNFRLVDAQDIPFDEAQFDAVIANFMLYHVPDRPRALKEIRRVLKPGGIFFAATVGERHMQELLELPYRFDPSGKTEQMQMQNEFTLENGLAQISKFFASVELTRYQDSLLVTDADALVNYLFSTSTFDLPEKREECAEFVRQVWEDSGGRFAVTKDSGMFIAR